MKSAVASITPAELVHATNSSDILSQATEPLSMCITIELACTMTCKLLPCCKGILQTFKGFMASVIHKMASAVISEHLISNTPNSYECLRMHSSVVPPNLNTPFQTLGSMTGLCDRKRCITTASLFTQVKQVCCS